MVHEEAEVLEAPIDGQVNDRAKLVQILDYFISKGLGLHMIFNMDTRGNDVPQELGPFGLHLGCQHFVHVGLYVFPCSAYMVTGPDRCWGTLDCGVVCIIVVLNYLGQDIKISVQVTCRHVLHNHALYCSIKLLHLPIAAGLIWEAGNMLDMEVIKQLLHEGIGELAAIVTLEELGGMLFEEWSKHL